MNFLVTAIGSLSAESALMSLRAFPGHRIVGCNTTPAEWIPASSLVDAFHVVPPASDPEFVHCIRDICRAERITHVLPLTDPEVDALNGERDVHAMQGVTLCMASREAVSTARDKWHAFEVFRMDELVPTIPTWRMDDLPDTGLPFPLIAKPRMGRSSVGLVEVHSSEELRRCAIGLLGGQYIVQPRIEGCVCVVDAVRQKSAARYASVARKELLRTSNGAGLTVETLYDERMDAAARRVMEALDINGCVNIEFIVRDGLPLLMDINPRFSAGIAFSKLAGYDMVANHLRCFTGEAIDDGIRPGRAIYARRYQEIAMTMDS